MNKILFVFLSLINISFSLQLPLARLNNNQLSNYYFHIKHGAVYGNAIQCLNPYLDTDNRKNYKFEIAFLYNNSRSIINLEYEKDTNNRILFKNVNMIGNTNNDEYIYNIWSLIKIVSKWKGKFQSIHSHLNTTRRLIYDIDSYDFKYFFMDISEKKRICHVGINNLILSVPKEIEDYKQFSIIFGCLLSSNVYNQVNMNYNYNGYLTTINFYEYQPNLKLKLNLKLKSMLFDFLQKYIKKD